MTCACHSSQWSTPMDSISTVHSITGCSLCSLCWCGNHRSTGMVLPSPLIACLLITIMNTCWIIVRDIDIEISQNDLKHMASDRTNKHLESLSSYLLYPSKTTIDQNPPANSWQSSSKKSICVYIFRLCMKTISCSSSSTWWFQPASTWVKYSEVWNPQQNSSDLNCHVVAFQGFVVQSQLL